MNRKILYILMAISFLCVRVHSIFAYIFVALLGYWFYLTKDERKLKRKKAKMERDIKRQVKKEMRMKEFYESEEGQKYLQDLSNRLDKADKLLDSADDHLSSADDDLKDMFDQ